MTARPDWEMIAERVAIIRSAETDGRLVNGYHSDPPSVAEFDQYGSQIRDMLDDLGCPITDPDALGWVLTGLAFGEYLLAIGAELGAISTEPVAALWGATNGVLHALDGAGLLPAEVDQ